MVEYLILHAAVTVVLLLGAGLFASIASDSTDPTAPAAARKAARVALTSWAWPVWLAIVLARAAVWLWRTATEPGGSR